jgi:hypothetical protein
VDLDASAITHSPVYARHNTARDRVLARAAMERLVDEIESLERLALDDEIDRDELRAKINLALTLSLAILDTMPPLEP